MILGQSSPEHLALLTKAGGATLDDLFRRTAARRPDAIALVDPPNRESVADGPRRRLTYSQADHVISAMAGRLRRIGLHTDDVVGLQMANTVDGVLTLLAVVRAGLIATPLPLLWRQADCVRALARVGAKALVVNARIGAADHCTLAMNVAADIFHMRQVCGFGRDLPDGVTPFDDLYDTTTPDPLPAIARPVNPAGHVAAITWDVSPAGLVPVARSHFEFVAAGAAVTLESRIAQSAVILSSIAMSSFAGLALTVLPWLLIGGTLVLHHPFDPAVLTQQCKDDRCAVVILPGPLAQRLSEASAFNRRGVKTVIAAWRTPERLAGSAGWRDPAIALIDVPIFGETALLAARRLGNGRAVPYALGPVTAPRGSPGALQVAQLARTEEGTLAVRGPMVPKFSFHSAADGEADPAFKIGPDGFVDTGYACRADQSTRALTITAPPNGIVAVGGYRFALRALKELAAGAEAGSTLAVVPDPAVGQRLAGSARDAEHVRQELAARGINPLVIEAFRLAADRRAAG
jgi:hypothetical protein